MTTVFISGGAKAYVGGTLTELTGKDISGDTVVMGLSTDELTQPTNWFAPDSSTSPIVSQRLLKLLVSLVLPASHAPIAGRSYYVWAKITDNPEILPIVLQQFDTR